jgi:pimeloyl-ACP methyl ester carboxylesterase
VSNPARAVDVSRRPRAWRRRALLYLGGLATLEVAFLGLVVVPVKLMYDQTHPPKVPLTDSPTLHGLAFSSISFDSPLDGTTLRGWYLPTSRPTGRTVVIAPGISDNRQAGGITLSLAPALLDAGFDVLAFDFRAEGESDGDTLSFGVREQDDLLGAIAFARGRGARHVVVIGYSMGGAAAILAAARSPDIEAIVADSAFADLRAVIERRMKTSMGVPGFLVPYGLFLCGAMSGTDPASAVPSDVVEAVAPRPMLFIAGTADSLVPAADAQTLAARAGPSAELWLVQGAEHVGSFAADPARYVARVVAFLETSLPEPRGP